MASEKSQKANCRDIYRKTKEKECRYKWTDRDGITCHKAYHDEK